MIGIIKAALLVFVVAPALSVILIYLGVKALRELDSPGEV